MLTDKGVFFYGEGYWNTKGIAVNFGQDSSPTSREKKNRQGMEPRLFLIVDVILSMCSWPV